MPKSNIGRYRDLAYDLLLKYKSLRDDSEKLYLACVQAIRGDEYIREVTLVDHFNKNKNDKSLEPIPTVSSIIRLSTDLQKLHPEIRGDEWESRQRHSKDCQEDLGYGK